MGRILRTDMEHSLTNGLCLLNAQIELHASGDVVARQSTQTTLTCTAHGGERGATATFSIAGDNKLVRISGGMLPVTRFVPPGQKLEFEIEYEGCLPSGSEDDIVATARMTGEGVPTTTQTDELTSVKVELQAAYEAPENPNPTRHLYGVGEKVKLRHWPLEANVSWRLGDDDMYSSLLTGDDCDQVLQLHYLGGRQTELQAWYREFRYEPTVALVEPSEVICRDAEWNGSCLPRGQAGGFGMYLELYVGPMYVSFQGIDAAEIPCASVLPPTGYYASTNFNGVLSHTSAAGAGIWHHIGGNNRWCRDNAGSECRRPPWAVGCLTWKIPIQWYQRLEANASWPDDFVHTEGRLIGGCDSAYLQVFEMTDSGTIRVTKHAHWIDRSTNDVIRLDGFQIHAGEF